MSTPAHQLATQAIYNECLTYMSFAAMELGVSNSKAASGGNIALILVKSNGKEVWRQPAFSNSSSLPKAVKADFSPSVPQAHLGMVGIPNGSQHANHTEPKLLDHFRSKLPSLRGVGYDEIIIASELDCCTSCVKNTISAITALATLADMGSSTPLKFYVVEVNSGRVREGHEF